MTRQRIEPIPMGRGQRAAQAGCTFLLWASVLLIGLTAVAWLVINLWHVVRGR